MKLNQLINGSGQTDFILIQDTKDAKGDILLLEFIKQNVKLGNKTDLLCVERNPYVLQNLPVASNFNTYFIRGSLVLKKEDSPNNIEMDADPFKILKESRSKSNLHSKNVVIIDSLSLLLLLYPDRCYREIHNFLNPQTSGAAQCQLICLLHNDVIRSGEKTHLMFERLAFTNVYVGLENKQYHATIKHRKASGRIIEALEQYYFDKDSNLITKEILKVKETHPVDDNKDWMTKDITFKLDLGEEEKRARSELVLPYVKTHKTEGSGEIFYEPDATDDWDEEDPDDDLNI